MQASNGLPTFRSEEALIGFDVDLRVVCWNQAAEWLTGLKAEEVLGKGCCFKHQSLPDGGAALLESACRHTQIARKGGSVPRCNLVLPDGNGGRRVTLSTVVVAAGDRPVFLHLARNGSDAEEPQAALDEPAPSLTPRQRQMLELLADGMPAKVIAARLGISLTTVRNHIHGLLVELRCHSQLEAVARARSLDLL